MSQVLHVPITIITCHHQGLTLLGGLLSMEQEMKADLSPPASELTTASPDLTEGGSEKWSGDNHLSQYCGGDKYRVLYYE